MTTLIKNGTIVTAQRTFSADVLIENEAIKDIATSIPAEGAGKIIDAKGCWFFRAALMFILTSICRLAGQLPQTILRLARKRQPLVAQPR